MAINDAIHSSDGEAVWIRKTEMSNCDPRVSVIVPTWNRSHCLRFSVESILAQDCEQFEVILVDDGSTDDTPAEVARLAASDSRIRVFQQPNQGQSAAFNRGLAEARGEFAIMLSDDDVLYPRCLSAVVPVFDENPSVIVVAGEFDMIDWDNKVLRSHRSSSISLKTFFVDHLCNIGVGAAFRTETARLAGGWNPRYRHVPDMDFWMRMGLLGDFHHIPVKLGGWREHTGQVSAHAREGSEECAKEHLRCINEILEQRDLPDELRALSGRARASAHIVAAIVTDPGLIEPDRRFLILDRISMSLDSEGRAGKSEDALRYLYVTAEERLQLINTLDADLRTSHSLIETLKAELEAERSRNSIWDRPGKKRGGSTFLRRLRSLMPR